MNEVKTISTEQGCIYICSDFSNKLTNVSQPNRIFEDFRLCFKHPSHTERVDSLLNNKWTDQKNHSSLEPTELKS